AEVVLVVVLREPLERPAGSLTRLSERQGPRARRRQAAARPGAGQGAWHGNQDTAAGRGGGAVGVRRGHRAGQGGAAIGDPDRVCRGRSAKDRRAVALPLALERRRVVHPGALRAGEVVIRQRRPRDHGPRNVDGGPSSAAGAAAASGGAELGDERVIAARGALARLSRAAGHWEVGGGGPTGDIDRSARIERDPVSRLRTMARSHGYVDVRPA